MIQQAPRVETEDMARGTRIHKALETGDPSGLKQDERETCDRLMDVAAEIESEWARDNGLSLLDGRIMRELRSWVTRYGTPVCSAKVDRLVIHRHNVLIVDFKTGWSDTEDPRENVQLMTQVACVAQSLGTGSLAIRVALAERWKPKSPCVFQGDDIIRAIDLVTKLAIEATAPDAPLTPGEHCGKCQASSICPKGQGFITALAETKGTRWDAMPVVDKVKLFELAKLAKKIGTQIEKNFKADVEAGAIPGWSIGEGDNVRTVIDLPGVLAKLESEFHDQEPHLIQEKFTAACKLPIGALEEVVAALGDMKPSEAARWVNTKLAAHIELNQKAGSVERVKQPEEVAA